jgi:hypothetical protein
MNELMHPSGLTRPVSRKSMNPDLILEGVIIAVLVAVGVLLFWR